MKQLFTILTLLLHTLVGSATILSFEDGKIENLSISNGQMTITDQYAKLGDSSLQWQWVSGGVLSLTSDELKSVSTTKNAGVYLWVFNDTALPNEKMVVAFKNSSGTTKCSIDYNLNFTGWRILQARFSDMSHDYTTLTTMEFRMPSTSGGTLRLDYVEFQSSVSWERTSDMQFTVDQSTQIEDFVGEYNKSFPTVTPTSEQREAVATILQRLDEWFVWNDTYATATEMVARKAALTTKMTKAKSTTYPAYNLSKRSDGSIHGCGLYPQNFTSTSEGTSLTTFRDISEDGLLPLAYNARVNNDAMSLEYVKNILKWYDEQGWAMGSGLGYLRFEKLRSSGYFHTIFLVRDLLDEADLQEAIETIHWYSLAGKTVAPYEYDGDNTDDMRTLLIPKLYHAIFQSDLTDAVSALESLRSYANKSLLTVANYADMIKPDFTGYHHRGVYMGAYFPDGVYAASLLCYLLHDTPFALSDEATYNLTQSLIHFGEIAALYDVPAAANGRFPNGNTILDQMLPAAAYVALSTNNNSELIELLHKRWDTSYSEVSSYASSFATDICHKKTLGEIGLVLTALEQEPEVMPTEKEFANFYPYAGMLIHRTPTTHLSVKGYNSYVWDFEGSASENTYGRYLSYGQIEITNLLTGVNNRAYTYSYYDWNLIPGTTTRYLSSSLLSYTGGGSVYRNFSDSEFLSGFALNGVSLFSLQLHDNTYDTSFYANKSVFAVGDTLYCMGSNISCSSDVPIQTTLWQQGWAIGNSIAINSEAVKSFPVTVEKPTLLCNQGHGFVVTDGTVQVETDKYGTLTKAYISHGDEGCTDASYGYYLLPQTDSEALQQFESPMQVLCSDANAHVVKIASENVTLAAIFDADKAQDFGTLVQVSKPVTLALFEDDTKVQLVVADPDMQRATSSSQDNLSDEEVYAYAIPTQVEIVLNGYYELKEGEASITCRDYKSYITLTLVNGMQQAITLSVDTLSVYETEVDKAQCRYDSTQKLVKINCPYDEQVALKLYDAQGRLQMSKTVDNGNIISLASFGHGIYLLSYNNKTIKITI